MLRKAHSRLPGAPGTFMFTSRDWTTSILQSLSYFPARLDYEFVASPLFSFLGGFFSLNRTSLHICRDTHLHPQTHDNNHRASPWIKHHPEMRVVAAKTYQKALPAIKMSARPGPMPTAWVHSRLIRRQT